MKKHKGFSVVKTVAAPAPRKGDDEAAQDILLNFYNDLGWNPKTHILDPTKIKTPQLIYKEILTAMKENGMDATDAGLLMMNRGPSVDDDVKVSMVYLLEGWIQEDES